MSVTLEERPSAKAQMPFKLTNNGRQQVIFVEWEHEISLPDGRKKKLPFTLEVDAGIHSELGKRIVELMKMFRDLEARQDGILKERDEALAAQSKAEGQAEKYRRELEGLRRQQKGDK